MSSLPIALRRQLEGAVKQARKIAEAGARHALEALAVHEPDPYPHMSEPQRLLRRHLRAQAKQLGDGESHMRPAAYEIKHLAEKVAYDQWHRLLFARYLLENNLLISPAHGVAVSLDDCEELSPSLGLKDAWAVAARFAAKELPQIFRGDDPAGAVDLSVNDRKPLVGLVTGLAVDVFTADDSLGWCYQFWQAERKDEVNAEGNKIGADELPAVTQLFTEDYMVDFLLDNTLGAWYAGKALAANPKLAANAKSEAELRQAIALPGCPWKYLRFLQGKDDQWTPAAGTFDGWPKSAKELKCLDPCMGSGHFVVAMFERLAALRLVEEKQDEPDTVDAVIRDNLFGLEIDPRCTQIGAFNLALAAWRRVGHRLLPAMNLACSGLAPNAKREDWLKLAGDSDRLQRGMARFYTLFKDAPTLGSLINPRATGGDLVDADFHELQPLLEEALAREVNEDTAHEMGVTARGIARTAEILAGQFTLVATNVPYLGRGKQDLILQEFCERIHTDAKSDLATCFVERCLAFCSREGSIALVTPQSWWFQSSSKDLRIEVLRTQTERLIATLGEEAWQSFGNRGPVASLMILENHSPPEEHALFGVDALPRNKIAEKDLELQDGQLIRLTQCGHVQNPDHRITIQEGFRGTLLQDFADSYLGLGTGDAPHFTRAFWELPNLPEEWSTLQAGPSERSADGGREQIVAWDKAVERVLGMSDEERKQGHNQDYRGRSAWGRKGIAISLMRTLRATAYDGDLFEKSIAVLIPKSKDALLAIKAFTDSPEYVEAVKRLDKRVMVTNATLVKVPFDLVRWQAVAAKKYPEGLPTTTSTDPTQWLFNGHPEGAKRALHVALARLVGYKWPRQSGASFPDCPALGPDGLAALADVDGIVCISATKGEATAAERLRELLAQATGGFDLGALLNSADPNGKSETLEGWLRDEFFEQHCALFHQRPFVWQLWDGHKSGFSALLNYHQLNHATLEKLTYAHLGDWIRRQQAAVDAGEAGSDARLAAAKQLQSRLRLILEGEPPYDIFVRWKSLSRQAIGWQPDINDGVKVNIRPFLAQDMPGGKKGAGILRSKPSISWGPKADRGKEPARNKAEFPWFWGWDGRIQDFAGVGKEPDGNRWNDCHYSNEFKRKARGG